MDGVNHGYLTHRRDRPTKKQRLGKKAKLAKLANLQKQEEEFIPPLPTIEPEPQPQKPLIILTLEEKINLFRSILCENCFIHGLCETCYVLRMWEKNLWTGSFLNVAQNELVYGISWGTLQSLRSLWPRTVHMIVSVWNPTGSTSSPSGVFPGPRGGEVDVILVLPRWCVMRDQEPAPSGPWSGSAYWTQVSEPVLLRASQVCPRILRPAKRRLGLRELG